MFRLVRLLADFKKTKRGLKADKKPTSSGLPADFKQSLRLRL